MATSVLMASNDHKNGDASLPLPQNHDHAPPMRRSSGRKKGNKGCDPSAGGQQKKKTPQRGMGVEKLERLRIQERLKKMNEINQGFGLTPVAPFSDPLAFIVNGSQVPLQFSKLGGGFVAPPNVGPPTEMIQNQGGMGASMGIRGDHQFRTDFLGVGCLKHLEFLGKNNVVSGISRDLCSTPNVVVQCFSEHCNICHKKKRVNGENSATGGLLRPDIYNSVGEWGFWGSNCGDNQNIINQENHVNGALVSHKGLAVGNGKQGVEVVAVHRKGSSSAEGGGVLMEYEFFPSGKGPNNTHTGDDSVLMKQMQLENCSSSSMDMLPSMATGMILDHSSTTGSSIDLSLKLSYH